MQRYLSNLDLKERTQEYDKILKRVIEDAEILKSLNNKSSRVDSSVTATRYFAKFSANSNVILTMFLEQKQTELGAKNKKIFFFNFQFIVCTPSSLSTISFSVLGVVLD